jgi:FMNH2-dependent dimethyl sulfone monooxygenase
MSIRLGLFYPNASSVHIKSRSVVAANLDLLDFATHTKVAQAAEEIGLDYMFLADAWAPYGPNSRNSGVMDPILLSPMLGLHLLAATKRIRCITTIHTSWFHPLVIARMGGALDAMSNGRWGVNLVTSDGGADNLAPDFFGKVDHNQRYERASEMVEILIQAWSQDTIDYTGQHFRIHGQLVGPRTRQQPRPLIVSAGASDAGRAFAGRYADYIFMPGRTAVEELTFRLSDIRRIAHESRRPADAIKLQMHVSLVVRETAAEAREVSERYAATIDRDITAEYLAGIRGKSTTYDDIYRSLGDADFRQIGLVSGANKVHGGADEVADQIETLHRQFGCDGLAITLPIWSPEEIRRVGELVLPRLQAKGIWAPPHTRNWSW